MYSKCPFLVCSFFFFFFLNIWRIPSDISFYIHLAGNCAFFSWLSFLSAWASLVAQLVKNPPAMQEIWVQSLCWEYSLEEGMATHSSILAWRIPMDRGAWRATAHGVTQSQT